MPASRRTLLTATAAATAAGLLFGDRAGARPAATTDRYPSNTALYADPALSEGVDYRLRYRLASDQLTRPDPVAVLGPHGGGVEPGTSELVLGFAGLHPATLEPLFGDAPRFDWWMFEGIRPSGNAELHVTSTHCDDRIALALCDRCDTAVALHGCSEKAAGVEPGTAAVLVGGRDPDRHTALLRELTAAGFDARDARDHPDLGGTDPDNICNRTRSGGGVQLELTRPLRDSLYDDPGDRPGSFNRAFRDFVSAGRAAMSTKPA